MKVEYTYKNYQCKSCNSKIFTGTNHYGEIYLMCRSCRTTTVWECIDEIPKGAWIPKPWKLVKLKDIAEIRNVR